jgi:hypothetical protein
MPTERGRRSRTSVLQVGGLGGGRFGVQAGGVQLIGQDDQVAAHSGDVRTRSSGDLPVGLGRFHRDGTGLVGMTVSDVSPDQNVLRLGEGSAVTQQLFAGGAPWHMTSAAV